MVINKQTTLLNKDDGKIDQFTRCSKTFFHHCTSTNLVVLNLTFLLNYAILGNNDQQKIFQALSGTRVASKVWLCAF